MPRRGSSSREYLLPMHGRQRFGPVTLSNTLVVVLLLASLACYTFIGYAYYSRSSGNDDEQGGASSANSGDIDVIDMDAPAKAMDADRSQPRHRTDPDALDLSMNAFGESNREQLRVTNEILAQRKKEQALEEMENLAGQRVSMNQGVAEGREAREQRKLELERMAMEDQQRQAELEELDRKRVLKEELREKLRVEEEQRAADQARAIEQQRNDQEQQQLMQQQQGSSGDSGGLVTSDEQPVGLYALRAKDITGNMRPLSEFKGKVLLIVNVASKCGYTDSNYRGLVATYEKYKDYGLEILAFPCDAFNHQEPDDDPTINQFCTRNYGVSFPMFSKIQDVNGPNADPIFKFLTAETPPQGGGGQPIRWNFFKFLVDKQGHPVKMLDQNWDSGLVEGEVYKLLTQQ